MSLIGYARVSTAEGRQWQASTCLPPSSSTGTPPGWAKRSLGEDMPACPWSPSSCHTSRPSVGPTSCSPANTDGKNAELSLTCHFALFRNRPHVGEAGRSLKIAYKYGELLQVRSQNYSRRTLNELTNSYPSHGFIIDRLQAENLFKNVRPPTPNEVALVTLLGNAALDPIPFPNKPLLAFLNSEPEEKSQELPSNQRSDDEPETTTPSADVEASEQSGDPGQTLHELVRIRPHDSAKSARIQEADSIRRLTRLTQRDRENSKGYPCTSR